MCATQAFLFSSMHPSIRIISLIVFATALSRGSWAEIGLSATVLGLLYLFQPLTSIKKAAKMGYKLKWFYLSIFIVYIAFAPEHLPAHEPWLDALARILILLLIVLAVNLLICSTARQQLVSGIYYLSQPLKCIHFDPQRLAARIVLSLEYVESLLHKKPEITSSGSPLQRLADSGAAWVRQVEQQSQQASSIEIKLENHHPPLYQWLVPMTIFAVFLVM